MCISKYKNAAAHNTELLLFDKQNHKAPHTDIHIVCIAWHTFN